MATILLSAAGAAIGSGFGGTVLGLSGAVIGRAVGATLGRAIDQRLMGQGSQVVETGRIERFRVMGAAEGSSIGQVYGRVRIGGQVIWATRFRENVTTTSSGGGKGSPKPKVVQNSYSYTVSLAVALCEGQIQRVGRIWADGVEVARNTLGIRIYGGSEDQLPDPKIEAVEGAGMAPSYRGIAYVVFENLELSRFGNRVPQFSFEVIRPTQGEVARNTYDMRSAVRAVALMPGTGEYALATTPVHYSLGPGQNRAANMNFPSGNTDMATSLEHLRGELPSVKSASLVVSWFGGDLRCNLCKVKPKVEQKGNDGVGMAWRAGGIARAAAETIVRIDGRPVYGGTPADASVIEAIKAIRSGGQEVMFYPFLLMEQGAGNTLNDPWTGQQGQPVYPWRGRITLSVAPGRDGSPDRTANAEAEVAAFFGVAQPGHFSRVGRGVNYFGPANDWGYRRFILHYAHLCVAAGGVDTFCIGSELRGLTHIRGVDDSFPAVTAFRQLAADVRAILGPFVRISYAADWSEYFGLHDASGNVYFHLDALWADPNIDFIGIDNYMPLSDWRDGETHADAAWGSIYNLDYLKANIAGGEGFDWYYDGPEGEAAQVRRPITDGAFGEPWVFRYKDIRSWWSELHFDRVDGVRRSLPTAWVPKSKPIVFTELGCPAIDKGTNEPNKFVDPKSSESRAPKYSSGRRDDVIQMQYLRAQAEYWSDPARNPVSPLYGERMVDWSRAHVWAWDARPFPMFPNLLSAWSDGDNYARGHWLNGRSTGQLLSSVVADICEKSGLTDFDVSKLYGVVRGYSISQIDTARAALQPLMLAYGFDAVERDGLLRFVLRDARLTETLQKERLAVSAEIDGAVETTRAAAAEMVGRVRLGFIDAESNFEARQAEATFPDDDSLTVSQSDLALSLTAAEGRGIVERWLSEARVARDSARFALPRSALHLAAGDVVGVDGARYRIDRIEQAEYQQVEAVRVEAASYQPSDATEVRRPVKPTISPLPVHAVFLDLPLLDGTEVPHAPYVAVSATPWPGPVGVWSSASDDGYALNRLITVPSLVGITESALPRARSGVFDRGPPLRVRVYAGALSSAEEAQMLDGINAVAIGDGTSGVWEVFQFGTAELVAPQTYELRRRLRGQAGTDAVMIDVWPEGSTVVFLDRGLEQIDLGQQARGLARHYRIGAGQLGYDHPATIHKVESFAGVGLRPYRPVHLRGRLVSSGVLNLSWTRRTRIDGDGWHIGDVPLSEDRETYQVSVLAGATLLREVNVGAPTWSYSAAQRAADGATGLLSVEVAQVSDRFGPGPVARLQISV
ncbi:MAG: host specificity protein [Cereibacter sphaeroides]|uniref:Host specificity protein n=1 Tax=Cereibacter sphaeroides TaxID=1063 RepID=A0A2W5SCF9_CERSP|nr:MAG: host specificity protein [Cereibacter sphaeroides]